MQLAPGNSGAPYIHFNHVATSFGGMPVYRDMGFGVARGEFVCLLGPSGCGKSTALRLLAGLMEPDSGSITVDGESPAVAWLHMAFVFQSPRLAPWRSALDNVLLGMELREGKTGPEHRRRAQELLAMVGLSKDMDKYPRMLSGGERQRVALARALGVNPDIVLMDEPFSALDPNTRTRLRAELIDIWRKTQKTILFVTHDVDEAVTLADRVLLFSNKPTRIIADVALTAARPRDLRSMPDVAAARDALMGKFRSLETQVGNEERAETT